MTDSSILLEIDDVAKHFQQQTSILDSIFGAGDAIHAVDGVTFDVRENDLIGVIGESGCGKTTLLKLLIGLEKATSGELRFRGESTTDFGRSDWMQFRREVQMIFQNPFDSLDKKMTVEEALREPLNIHGIGDQRARVEQVLEQVELTPPDLYLDSRPNELSGGELQRVSIARALILEPRILLADEPVSMLDVSTQASVLKLLSRLTKEENMALVYISHDISTVSHICEQLHVMYRGRIVESGRVRDIIDEPHHPYSEALINAIPIPDPYHERERSKIQGTVSDPVAIGEGCRFRDRCPERMDVCEQTPLDVEMEDERVVACHLFYDHGELDREDISTSERIPEEAR